MITMNNTAYAKAVIREYSIAAKVSTHMAAIPLSTVPLSLDFQ